MDHPTTADSTPAHAPSRPRRRPVVGGEASRFSALTAPQREAVDTFLEDNRAWALRQARRAYRHLPESLREQAVDRAFTELQTRTPRSLERRALAGELAERLTESLRHVHVGWCLNESSALLRREGTEPLQPEIRRDGLASFIDEGLGGLERAVLQLEIGAGRDTRTARAALRLGPRQYTAHREAGLSKLRDAISAQILGRACDQHAGSVVAAATGDRQAMDALNAGPQRCRYCAREAQGLRSVLHERLAVAPWPLAIAPASALVAKLSAIGSVVGAKSAGSAGSGSLALGAGGSGASAAATVLAAAALATGTAALIDGESSQQKLRTKEARPAAVDASGNGSKAEAKTRAAASKARQARLKARRADARSAGQAQAAVGAPEALPPSVAAVPPTSAAPSAAPSAAGAPATSGPITSATEPVTETVDRTVEKVTSLVPGRAGQTVKDTLDGATNTVDEVNGIVDGLLPKP